MLDYSNLYLKTDVLLPQPNGSVAYISTNTDESLFSTHLLKIEVYELKTLAKIPSAQHWKNAKIRIKYYVDETNKNFIFI